VHLLDLRRRRVLAALASARPLGRPAAAQTPAYQNESLSFEARAADLVSRMTLEEKANQMKDAAPAIERLGVPVYNWWNEALHGVARSGLATVFPQAIGFAATWDDSLVFRMASVISDEARAKHHEYVRAISGSATRDSRSGRRTSTSSAIPAGAAGRRRTARIPSSPAGSASSSSAVCRETTRSTTRPSRR
jgi:hypothetical protein